MAALVHDQRVLTNKGYCHLYDCGFLKDKGRLYFENDLGIPDSVFLKHNLKPIPVGRELNIGKGDVIISFSCRDIERKPTDSIQFCYRFGSTGAQMYELTVYKSLLMRYFIYIHRGAS